MSWKNIQYGKKRVRRNYSRVQTNVELPNLIEVQTESFKWLMDEGLKILREDIKRRALDEKTYLDRDLYKTYFGELGVSNYDDMLFALGKKVFSCF